MGLYGCLCLAETHQYDAIVDYLFRQTVSGVERGVREGFSRLRMGGRLMEKLGLSGFDVGRVFDDMDRKYKRELVDLGVIMPNPEFRRDNVK